MAAVAPELQVESLPIPRTRLIGRETERAAARRLLLHHAVPVLTLTGPGGVGKTRLALAIAQDVADAFTDGVAFVDLSPLADPALVLPAIAGAVGVIESGGGLLAKQLAAVLRPRQLLLLLDNCEHLLASVAGLVADLLTACPAVQVIATSRAPLRVRGERELPVSPLVLPSRGAGLADVARADAVALFVRRAQAVRPDFEVTEQNAAAVAEVCHRLDGLPLAIELAAAWMKALPPPVLLDRLGGRLLELTGGRRDLPARQQTLRDTIAWSHDLLGVDERTLFRQLGTFVGGWTIEAAESVATAGVPSGLDVLAGLAALVDHSLVRQEEGPAGEPRYAMLETIRAYAEEQLAASGETVAARDAHAAFFLTLVEAAEPRLHGPEQLMWLDRLEVEHDNLRAALAWTLERSETESALRLAGALGEFWRVRGHLSEGRAWLDRALEGGDGAARAKALQEAGTLAWCQGDFEVAAVLLEESLARWRALDDPGGIAWTLAFLADAVGDRSESDRAIALYEEALFLFRRLADERGIAMVANNLGVEAQRRGDLDRAETLFAEALALDRKHGNQGWVSLRLANLADIALLRDRAAEATTLFRESLTEARALGHKTVCLVGVVGMARTAAATGYPRRAARLLGAAEAYGEAIGAAIQMGEREGFERAVTLVREALGEEELAAEFAVGRALSPEQAVAEALAPTTEPEAAPPPAPSAPGDPFRLTRREREVLTRLAQRLTNKEIAEELFLSPRTVQTHTISIFTKLGVDNRRDAAALAARHELA
jgi:predicted ATPase/DNA-binding CsgD family transcriptional regulator